MDVTKYLVNSSIGYVYKHIDNHWLYNKMVVLTYIVWRHFLALFKIEGKHPYFYGFTKDLLAVASHTYNFT